MLQEENVAPGSKMPSVLNRTELYTNTVRKIKDIDEYQEEFS